MRCLVTGGTGFTGSSLLGLLQQQGRQVTVLVRAGSSAHLPSGVNSITGDIVHQDRVAEVLEQIKPQEIYHLAARTFVPDAFLDGRSFLQSNLTGSVNILEAARRVVPESAILVVSSAGAYGAGGNPEKPFREEECLHPVDPYGVSKAAAEMWARQEALRSAMKIVCVRPFGHIGPRQSTRFVAANIAHQIQRILAQEQKPCLELGNVDAIREFTDVNDMAAGCVAALKNGQSGAVYNLCSGKGMTIREVARDMLAFAGVDAEIVTSGSRLRPVDIGCLVGSPDLARSELHWQPVIPWQKTVASMFPGFNCKAD